MKYRTSKASHAETFIKYNTFEASYTENFAKYKEIAADNWRQRPEPPHISQKGKLKENLGASHTETLVKYDTLKASHAETFVKYYTFKASYTENIVNTTLLRPPMQKPS